MVAPYETAMLKRPQWGRCDGVAGPPHSGNADCSERGTLFWVRASPAVDRARGGGVARNGAERTTRAQRCASLPVPRHAPTPEHVPSWGRWVVCFSVRGESFTENQPTGVFNEGKRGSGWAKASRSDCRRGRIGNARRQGSEPRAVRSLALHD